MKSSNNRCKCHLSLNTVLQKQTVFFSLGILISYPFRKIKFALELLPQFVITFFNHNWHSHDSFRRGSRGGEMGEFSPPFFRAPFCLFFSYPSNIKITFDFSYIITKIHPPFQNPRSPLRFMTSLFLVLFGKSWPQSIFVDEKKLTKIINNS